MFTLMRFAHIVNFFHIVLACSLLVLTTGDLASAAAPGGKTGAGGPIIKAARGIEPDGLTVISPTVWEGEAASGAPQFIDANLLNKSENPVIIDLEPTDLVPARDAESFVSPGQNSKFGAGEWIFPEHESFRLPPMTETTVRIRVEPPPNAPVGTNFGGVLVGIKSLKESKTEAGKSGGFKIVANTAALIQIYPTIPGEVKHDLRLTNPRLADSFIFGNAKFATFEFDVDNRGTVNDHISGKFTIDSVFGSRVATIEIKPTLVLRGGKRRIRGTWSDIPLFGRFEASAKVRSDDNTETIGFPALTISPPWWWYLVLVVALAIPVVGLMRRRRKRWMQYLDDDELWNEDSSDELDDVHQP